MSIGGQTYPRGVVRKDQRNIYTSYGFDRLDRLVRRWYGTNPDSDNKRREEFEYDRSGRLLQAEDHDGTGALQHTWGRGYDQAGRPTYEAQIFAGSQAAAYESFIEYGLDTSAHTFSQTICYPGANCASGGREVTRTWDKRQRMVDVFADANIGASWTYDAADRRASMHRLHPDNNMSFWSYDDNDRLTSLIHFAGPDPVPPGPPIAPVFAQNFTYDPLGNRRSAEQMAPDLLDRSEAYGHDNRNRLTTLERGSEIAVNPETGEASIPAEYRLRHDALPSRQQWIDLDRRGNWLMFAEEHWPQSEEEPVSRVETRTANGVNAYTDVDVDGPAVGDPCESGCIAGKMLKYDSVGNLTFDPWAPNVGDPCASAVPTECNTGGACDPTKPGCGLGQEYEYDGENRLVVVRRDTNDMAGRNVAGQPELNAIMEFRYDALGRRVETIEYVDAATGAVMDGVGGNAQPRTTRHVYVGLELVQEYGCDQSPACEQGGSGGAMPLVREFIHGDPERYSEVVAMVRHSPDTQDSWAYHYLHDPLGSVVGLVDSIGRLVERYTYDPYGMPYIERWDANANEGEGAWLASAEPNSGLPYSSLGNPFGFTGHVYLPAIGKNLAHFRVYDPRLGRWLQRDPIEYAAGSINQYEYVGANPISRLDPLGLAPGAAVPGGSVPAAVATAIANGDAAMLAALTGLSDAEAAAIIAGTYTVTFVGGTYILVEKSQVRAGKKWIPERPQPLGCRQKTKKQQQPKEGPPGPDPDRPPPKVPKPDDPPPSPKTNREQTILIVLTILRLLNILNH